MGLFSKKTCDICGAEIGLFGAKKLADGQMCKNCMEQMSHWITDRRDFTVAMAAEHLQYRQDNAAELESFRESGRAVCDGAVIAFDEADGTFLINPRENYLLDNPDVMTVDQITAVILRTDEQISEQKHDEPDLPPFTERRYAYSFRYDVQVNNAWFRDIRFNVNTFAISPDESAKMQAAANRIAAINGLFGAMGITVTPEDYSSFGYTNVLSGNLPPEVIDPMLARPQPRPAPRPAAVPPMAPNAGRPGSPAAGGPGHTPPHPAAGRPAAPNAARPGVPAAGGQGHMPARQTGRTAVPSAGRPCAPAAGSSGHTPARPAASGTARSGTSTAARPASGAGNPPSGTGGSGANRPASASSASRPARQNATRQSTAGTGRTEQPGASVQNRPGGNRPGGSTGNHGRSGPFGR